MSTLDPDYRFEDPRRVLRRYGLAPKREFSQNFLISEGAVRAIASATKAGGGERVVELGPGLGTLTSALIATGAEIVAVERDRDMAAILRDEFGEAEASGRFALVEGDAATVDLSSFGEELIVAGNLPYAITGAIFRNLTAHRASIRRAVVMIQREVADRLIAPPGTRQYGAPSVFVSASYRISRVMNLPPSAFFPPPKVASAVILLERLEEPRAVERPAFNELVHAIFESRRKTLRNSLRRFLADDAIEMIYESLGLGANLRGESLSVEEMDAIASEIERVRRG